MNSQSAGEKSSCSCAARVTTSSNSLRVRTFSPVRGRINKNWTASLFASQDQVAIDSVALDFLRNEPTVNSVVTGAVDNYLHEMAMAGKASAKNSYDPEKTGKKVTSMGVHEHWNNAADKKYSRNLGKGEGIELVDLNARPTS